VIKSLILRVLMNKRIAPIALRWVMKLHNALYDLSGSLAVIVNGGKHPKHRLLRYQEWFRDHIEPSWVVIDVGSNTGDMTALLADKARHVYGIEIVPDLAELARRNHVATNLEFLTGDATAFDYSSCQPIDCVTLSNVLEHIRERSTFVAMLRQRLPWRNPGHCNFLIRVPTIERDWLAPYKKETGVEYRLDRTHEIEHTREAFFEELAAAGLHVESFDVRFGEFYAVCKGKAE
jgi:2-polyprenyl-3-methyl-5-hydroxy-6-metoxy-1,4-benzoquinol methylase